MTLRVTFLGTSGAVPTPERNVSGLLVNREGDRLLFDAGEGTQRQMMRFNTGFDVSVLFLTHIHGDHCLGVPGLVQTWNFNDRDRPLTIYAPEGTGEEVRELVHAADTYPDFPLSIVEVTAGETAIENSEYRVDVLPAAHRATAVGYALVESDRKGRFDRDRAEELGVPPGPMFSRLHEGEAVELEDGTTVESEQVVGEPRPGRRLVISGDTRPTAAIIDAAAEADLLIHDATFTDEHAERARSTGHSTAREAGEVASTAGVRRLALTHFSSRYAGRIDRLRAEAADAYDGPVTAPDDGERIEVPFPDA